MLHRARLVLNSGISSAPHVALYEGTGRGERPHVARRPGPALLRFFAATNSSYVPLKSSILPPLEMPDARGYFIDDVVVVRHSSLSRHTLQRDVSAH